MDSLLVCAFMCNYKIESYEADKWVGNWTRRNYPCIASLWNESCSGNEQQAFLGNNSRIYAPGLVIYIYVRNTITKRGIGGHFELICESENFLGLSPFRHLMYFYSDLALLNVIYQFYSWFWLKVPWIYQERFAQLMIRKCLRGLFYGNYVIN